MMVWPHEALESRMLLSAASPAGAWAQLPPAVATLACPLNVPAAGDVMLNISAPAATPAAYRLVAPAQGRLVLLAQAIDPTADPALWVYDGAGNLLAQNDNVHRGSSDSLVRLRVAAGQVLTILSQTAQAGRYTLTATSEPTDDAGNTPATAQPLPLDGAGNARWCGRIDYPGDVDVLAVTARLAGTMHVTVSGLAGLGAGAGSLAVLDAAGQRINAVAAAGDGGGAAAQEFAFSVAAAGVYYVQAGPSGQTGPYCLAISTQTGDPPAPPAPARQNVLPAAPVNGTGTDTPGTAVTAEATVVDGQDELVINGTSAADHITLRQQDGVVTLETGGAVRAFAGAFTRIAIDTFGGDDVVTVAHSVSIPVLIRLGDGNDAIYDAGTGGSILQAGAGEDLLVSVGGGADRLIGGSGLDSFWCDAADTIVNVSAAERRVGAVHRISEFQQPITHDPNSASYVSLEIAGQNIPDPAIGAPAAGYANFADRPLFVGQPQYRDIEQGAVGDCYFLASLAGYAHASPQVIRQMIAPLGDGSYVVRFYRDGREAYVRINADLPVMPGGTLAYAGLGGQGQVWVPLVEKAYAVFRDELNSYIALGGGWMNDVYSDLTNAGGTSWQTSLKSNSQIYSTLQAELAAGRTVTAGSGFAEVAPIVTGHAYTVMSVDTSGGQLFVTVYNPWGIDGRPYDSNPYDGLLRLTISQFASAFTTICVSAG
jgi:hypothetical protein